MFLKILQDIAIPRPNIIDSIEEPPYESIGSGAPTMGSRPKTMPIFTVT